MGGRRPKPTALKQLAGNPGHRPLNDMEVKPEKVAPECPKGMRRAAKREWYNMVPQLMALNVLTKVDGKALMAYCDAYADWEESQKDCVKNGLVLDSPVLDKDNNPISIDGQLLRVRKENPAFAVKCKALKTLKSFLIEFGLTPASRSKLKIEPPKEVDPMEDIMARRGGISPVPQVPGAQPSTAYFDTGKTEQPAATPLSKDMDFN